MRVLITGAAGFIGAALSDAFVKRGDNVVGIDNFTHYYNVKLKEARVARLEVDARFTFARLDVSSRDQVSELFASSRFDVVVHLAAQAGVRYSIENPHAYGDSNLCGFLNILEGCRRSKVSHLIFASSSSVYGSRTHSPFSETDNVDHPVSLYAATKKANELMAHSYAHLYNLPCTGLRFFTVYGPWGRPDMAYFKFTQSILAGEPLPVFNGGDMMRDFTYIDDIVEGILRLIEHPATPDQTWKPTSPSPASSRAPYRIYNIGNSQPVNLLQFIRLLEDCLGKKASLNLMPMQPGDVPVTAADITALKALTGFAPRTPIESGIARFVEWYRQYYKV